MNDRYVNCVFYSVSGNSIEPVGEVTEPEPTSEPDIDIDNNSDIVSDALGDDSTNVTDTASDEEFVEDNSGSDSGSFISDNEGVTIQTIDYNSKLDSIINKLDDSNSVLHSISVSGNSVVVTMSDNDLQYIEEIKQQNIEVIEKIDSISNVVSCILLVVVMAYLIANSKRVVKQLFNRKD